MEFKAREPKHKQNTTSGNILKSQNKVDVHFSVLVRLYTGLQRLSQPSLSSFLTKPKEKVTVEMKVQEVELACLELITKNGLPFIALEDSGFKRLTKPLFDALDYGVDRKQIVKLLYATALAERNRVKKEIDGKLVCLKADTATRHK